MRAICGNGTSRKRRKEEDRQTLQSTIRHGVVFDLPRSVSRSVGRERVYGSARNWNVKEKCNVYSHTTSIFQDFSTKSPVTFGFSARQVIDFPWSSTPGSNSTVLTVRFSDLSSCEPSKKFSEIIFFLSITSICALCIINRAETATRIYRSS